MGTRAMIKFEGSEIVVYKHYDGYPEASYHWLYEFNAEFAKNRGDDVNYKLAQLLRSSVVNAKKYNLDDSKFTGWGLHGNAAELSDAWIEYTYTLHVDGTVSWVEGFDGSKPDRGLKKIDCPNILNFFSDSGHGWLKAPRALLDQLNLIDQITSFSFQRGEFVYLEEDQDAETLLKALKDNGHEPLIKTKNSDRSKIRSYERFSK